MGKLIFEVRSEYLYASIEGGIDSYEIALGYWRDITGELFQRNLKCVLVHESIVAELSDTEIFRIASELREIGFSGVKIAILAIDPAHKSAIEFGALVGTNRGLRVRSFETVEAAEGWLLATAA